MAYVHLADAPPFVLRWPEDFHALLLAAVIDAVHVVGPDHHPDAILSSTALAVAAQTDFEVVATNGAKRRFTTVYRPVPLANPAELFEPGEAFGQARDIENGHHRIDVHPLRADCQPRVLRCFDSTRKPTNLGDATLTDCHHLEHRLMSVGTVRRRLIDLQADEDGVLSRRHLQHAELHASEAHTMQAP